jgi:DNA-binding Lrp family transcriptional regulator
VQVDEAAFGLPVTAFVRVRLHRHDGKTIAAFGAAINRMDAVLDCYMMTGDADFLLRVLVQSLADYERFIRSQLHVVPGIASIDKSFAYSHVKRATVFPPVLGS